MPPRLEELRSDAQNAGNINTKLWKLKHRKNGDISLTRKAVAKIDGKKKRCFGLWKPSTTHMIY